MNELSSLRTETGKTFELDPKLKAGQYCLEARTGPIHYKETYSDREPWLDLDETYSEASEIKGIGKVLVYPKLPNIVTVFQDLCGYQIQSRSNPDHIAKVELVGIDGQEVTAWQKTAALNIHAKVHPFRVGIWKDFSQAAKTKSTTMRWKITEQGGPDKDSHPFFFRENPEAFTTAGLTDLSPAALDAAKVSIETARTRIDDTSWYWDEIVPAAAKLVDTDFQVGTSANDAYWHATSTFYGNATELTLGRWAVTTGYNCFANFTSIPIDPKSTIVTATMALKSISNYSGTTCSVRFTCNNVDSAVSPTTYAGAEALALTTAYANWSSIGAWTTDTVYTTPSLVSPIQEVINRSGWVYKNNVMVICKNNSSSDPAYRLAYSYDRNASHAPKLSIAWTPPGCIRSRIIVPNVSWLSKSLLKRREI